MIADFEAAHPDIRIKSEAISFSEIARQLALRVRAGNPPDVAQLAGNDTFVIAATGKLEPAEVAVRSTVQVVEMLGAEHYVHMAITGGALTARVPRQQAVHVDETVTFAAAARDVLLFDHATGRALR